MTARWKTDSKVSVGMAFCGGGEWAGNRAVLLPPSPLRTVRATFTAYGSSSQKCKFNHTAVSENYSPCSRTYTIHH